MGSFLLRKETDLINEEIPLKKVRYLVIFGINWKKFGITKKTVGILSKRFGNIENTVGIIKD